MRGGRVTTWDAGLPWTKPATGRRWGCIVGLLRLASSALGTGTAGALDCLDPRVLGRDSGYDIVTIAVISSPCLGDSGSVILRLVPFSRCAGYRPPPAKNSPRFPPGQTNLSAANQRGWVRPAIHDGPLGSQPASPRITILTQGIDRIGVPNIAKLCHSDSMPSSPS